MAIAALADDFDWGCVEGWRDGGMNGDGSGLLPRIDVLIRVMSSASKPVQGFGVRFMLECCKGANDECWTQ